MKKYGRTLTHIVLFVLTFITTTLAGAEWTFGRGIFAYTKSGFGLNPQFTWDIFLEGMRYSIPFLLILTVHEFGHYFTAMYHRVKASLPYYIPMPPLFISIGTLGAVIRLRSKVYSNIQHFDIGLAGPLAGFIVALAILFYGFKTLPPPEYIYKIHPEYEKYGPDYANHVYTKEFYNEHKVEGQTMVMELSIGSNLLFMFFENFVADPARVPNGYEMMHYPIIFAGFLALFFTSLNLLPIGQLDGGHVIYGLFGRKGHNIIATVFFILLLLYSGLGYVSMSEISEHLWVLPIGVGFYFICLQGLGLPQRDTLMYALLIVAFLVVMTWLFPNLHGYSGWLFFGLIVGRVLGVRHPTTEIEQPLDAKRQILGWICLIIFVLSFTPEPFRIIEIDLGN